MELKMVGINDKMLDVKTQIADEFVKNNLSFEEGKDNGKKYDMLLKWILQFGETCDRIIKKEGITDKEEIKKLLYLETKMVCPPTSINELIF